MTSSRPDQQVRVLDSKCTHGMCSWGNIAPSRIGGNGKYCMHHLLVFAYLQSDVPSRGSEQEKEEKEPLQIYRPRSGKPQGKRGGKRKNTGYRAPAAENSDELDNIVAAIESTPDAPEDVSTEPLVPSEFYEALWRWWKLFSLMALSIFLCGALMARMLASPHVRAPLASSRSGHAKSVVFSIPVYQASCEPYIE